MVAAHARRRRCSAKAGSRRRGRTSARRSSTSYDASDAAGITLVIDDLSSMALADDQPERASKLWGAGRAFAKATGATLASYTDGWIESQLRPNVRNSIEPADLQRWAAEGAALSLDEAVAYALGSTAEELETLRNSRID